MKHSNRHGLIHCYTLKYLNSKLHNSNGILAEVAFPNNFFHRFRYLNPLSVRLNLLNDCRISLK